MNTEFKKHKKADLGQPLIIMIINYSLTTFAACGPRFP